jgi:hypothetical protein
MSGGLSGGGRILDQFFYGVAWHRAGFTPAVRFFRLQSYSGRIGNRVIGPDLIDKAAVARRSGISHDDPEERSFAAAMAAEPDHESHLSRLHSWLLLVAKSESTHHGMTRAHLGDLFHHLAGLLELLDKSVNILD